MYFAPSFWLYPYQKLKSNIRFYKGYFDFLDSTND